MQNLACYGNNCLILMKNQKFRFVLINDLEVSSSVGKADRSKSQATVKLIELKFLLLLVTFNLCESRVKQLLSLMKHNIEHCKVLKTYEMISYFYLKFYIFRVLLRVLTFSARTSFCERQLPSSFVFFCILFIQLQS